MAMVERSGGQLSLRIEAPHPLVVGLMLFMGIIFALMRMLPGAGEFLVTWFALNTADFLGKFRVWQCLTAVFLHGSLCHLIGNLLFFYIFGNGIARAWRDREFLVYMAVCGIGANLIFWLFHVFAGENVVGLGASGVIFGLMGAYAIIYANRVLLLFLIIPIPVRVFVAICVAIEALLLVSSRQDGISHVAHLAGLAIGIVYVKLVHRRQDRQAGHSGQSGATGGRLRGLEVMRDDG